MGGIGMIKVKMTKCEFLLIFVDQTEAIDLDLDEGSGLVLLEYV